MNLYTTCADCLQPLSVTFTGQETHPGCQPTQTEQLARQFVDAVQRDDEPEMNRLEKLLNQPVLPQLGSSALWYAQQGWPVFPLAVNSKVPAIKNGFTKATTDLALIKDWWNKHPGHNIGLPTGIKFDVIDIDGPDGIRSLHDLGDSALPDIHGKVASPRGFHLFVLPTGDGNRAGVRPGIDYRGAGGYVCAPPSQLDLKRWAWIVKPSPEILKGAA